MFDNVLYNVRVKIGFSRAHLISSLTLWRVRQERNNRNVCEDLNCRKHEILLFFRVILCAYRPPQAWPTSPMLHLDVKIQLASRDQLGDCSVCSNIDFETLLPWASFQPFGRSSLDSAHITQTLYASNAVSWMSWTKSNNMIQIFLGSQLMMLLRQGLAWVIVQNFSHVSIASNCGQTRLFVRGDCAVIYSIIIMLRIYIGSDLINHITSSGKPDESFSQSMIKCIHS